MSVFAVIRALAEVERHRGAPAVGLRIDGKARLEGAGHDIDEALNLEFTGYATLGQIDQAGKLLVDDLVRGHSEPALKIAPEVGL